MENPNKVVTLDEIKDLVHFQRVNCDVKVVSVEGTKEVTGGKKLQNLLVGDCSAALRLTLWESEIGTMEEGSSYRGEGLMVREYKGKKFLSTSQENCKIVKIEDIGSIEELEESEEEDALFDHKRPIEVCISIFVVSFRFND